MKATYRKGNRGGRARSSLALWVMALAPLGLVAAEAAKPSDTGEKAFVESLLARMTLEEKLGQLNQPPGIGNDTGPKAKAAGTEQVRKGQVGSFLGMQGVKLTCDMQRIAVKESRLGIPLLFGFDVIHGYRTVFPVPLGEAASFNPIAVEKAARVGAVEATAHGINWTYAPMVDVARDPRWGRVVEGSGEDTYLGEVMAVARVRGFQGNDLRAADSVLATAKHFVAYGGAEAGRDYNTVDISERTLREVYLPPFHAAVDAGVGSIMASFNEIAGVPMHANGPLINGVLRGEWGFDGVLVSDYTGVMELMNHRIAANATEAGTRALNAGVDVDMVSDIYRKDMPKAVRAGKVSEATVDDAVRRVLLAKYRLGLFDNPYRNCDESLEKSQTLTADHRGAARTMARESMVLLKNKGNVLPLSKQIRTLAVIGPLADNPRAMLGSWAGMGRPEDVVTPLAGIRAAVGPETKVLYAHGADINTADTTGIAEAVRIAGQADAVLLMLGEAEDMSGEANNRTSLDLPGVQEQLALAVQKSGKPVAAVLFNGRPLSINSLQEQVPSILEAWFPGVEAGHALTDVLFGDYNPAGRLPITFPRNVGQVPIYYAHKNTGRPPREEERYSSKYLDVSWKPLYAFGHGLSYTSFRYDALRLSRKKIPTDGTLQVEVTVTNTGSRAGDEVVQLYLRDDVASVTRPVKQLRGFRRVHLQAGKSQTLTFTLTANDLSFYGADMKRIVEPGSFTVFAGGNSVDNLEAKFEVTAR